MDNAIQAERRPIFGRQSKINNKIAMKLVAMKVTPNQISILSIVFASAAAYPLMMSTRIADTSESVWCLLLAAAFVSMRLYCNLIDGMMAIEGGKITRSGVLFNELPDRVSDTLILLALGYASGPGYVELGWSAALLAMATAYIRVFGGSCGLAQDFKGPMAKQHRMFTVIVASLFGSLETTIYGTSYSLRIALLTIVAGSILTCARRVFRLRRQLENAS
ncbi:MAG: CDP-alcohol phosphatidyltransferase family protein [Candidatus Melainabacteria bacterium]|nr:CDP-alcohol phosphatidyltransferase family protein [Candidatus Melainabacteria bacterium]